MKKVLLSAAILAMAVAALALYFRRERRETLPTLENPRLVVKKNERNLQLFDGARLVKTYRIVLGSQPAGDKEREGDGKTPEGEFYLAVKNPKSQFFRSLGLSYPSAEDAERGRRNNLISSEERDEILRAIENKKMPPQKTRLGGEIYIHGGGVRGDWTAGCVALDDADMLELFDALPVGISVVIEP